MTTGFELKNFRKAYGARVVLDIESARFESGKITALAGPNGCGKTTLLECLNGLKQPDSGELLYRGEPLNHFARRNITLVFQQPHMFNSTVEYNVGYGLRLRGSRETAPINKALEAVRLGDFNNRVARSLSGGETKRVAIARALAFSPETLLLDEPTANIDPENAAIIEDVVRSLRDAGTTIIMATHDRAHASHLADSTFLIQEGRLVPFHPDNHFKATLTDEGGEKILRVGNILSAVVSTDRKPGDVYFTIEPEDIILSAKPFDSSARNCWLSVVQAIELINGGVRITCDAGVPVVAKVTRASYDSMRLAAGDALCLTFKASAIKIF